MNIHVNGEISRNFPLYHTNLIPIYQPLEKKSPKGKKVKELNFYTNEHPDFFRLDGMKLNGYRNPYLDEVIKVDRNEQFIKMNSNVDQINLINYIKSKREYSQDPKILRVIRNEFDIQMHKKRQQISEDRKKKRKANKYIIGINDINNYDKIIRDLDHYSPRIDYKMKRTIDSEENTKYIGKYLTSEDNFEKVKQISTQYNPHKSAYITNSNDYKISEAYGRDKLKEFSHKRKAINKFNIINYRNEKVIPPLSTNEKWGQFYENFYMTLLNNKKGFSQKGGLFTEFTNKNIGVINVNKRNFHEKLLKEKLGLNGLKTTIDNNSERVRNPNKTFNNIYKRNNSLKYNFIGLNRNLTTTDK
jgi:hypothetical protein